jgi:hypothetical protein
MVTTWDALGVLVIALWWVFYRKTLDWRAVAMFYLGGVFSGDLLSAGLLAFFPHSFPIPAAFRRLRA